MSAALQSVKTTGRKIALGTALTLNMLVNTARPNLNYRKDWKILQAVRDYIGAESITHIGNKEGLKVVVEKNTSAPCNVCDNNNDQYIHLNNYVAYVQNFTDNYTSGRHVDYQKVLGAQGIKSNGINQVNATAFILRVLAENPSYVSTISGFEEKIETINDAGETNRAFADIVENGDKIIECKSWSLNGISFQHFVSGTSGSVQQFITYLSDQQKVTSMQQIEYWFDKNKLGGSTDVAPIKQKFRQMMFSNGVLTQRGEDVFNAIWGNEGLREGIWNDIPKDIDDEDRDVYKNRFKDIVSGINNSFYHFIKIK